MNSPEAAVPEPLAAQPIVDEFCQAVVTQGFELAMRVHGDFHAAEDAGQEGMAALLEAIQKDQALEDPLDYTNDAARRKAIGDAKYRQRIYVDSETIAYILGDRAHTDDPFTFDSVEAVSQALASLRTPHASANRARALQLFAEGKTHEEIVAILGLNTGRQSALAARRSKITDAAGGVRPMNCPENTTFEQPYSDELCQAVALHGYQRAMRIHGDHHHAEDVGQESVLALLYAAQKGRAIYEPLAYADKVAQGKALLELKFRRRVYTDSEIVDHELTARTERDPSELIDTVVAVVQAIESLRGPHVTENHMVIIEMTAGGMFNDEVSQALGLTVGSVKAHLSRARAKLRERREKYGL